MGGTDVNGARGWMNIKWTRKGGGGNLRLKCQHSCEVAGFVDGMNMKCWHSCGVPECLGVESGSMGEPLH